MRRPFSPVLGLLCLSLLLAPAEARDITGKVMAVYHEKVNVNNNWLDKVSVTISNCNPAGQLETFAYSPGSLSDNNSLGSLYGQLVGSAHAMTMKTPFMSSVSGHVTLSANEHNTIQKTTFWGYNWECGKNLDAQQPKQPGFPAGVPGQGQQGFPQSAPFPQQGGFQQPGGFQPQGGFPPGTPQNGWPQPNNNPSGPSVNPMDIMRQFGF